MKKLLLTTAIAALSVTAAQAAPTVYGKAGAQINYTDSKVTIDGKEVASTDIAGDKFTTKKGTTLDNDSTRLGVKGSESLTNTIDAIYQLEYALTIDQDENNPDAQFKSRDTFVGLQHAQAGTLKFGRLSTVDDAVDYSNPTEAGGTKAAYQEDRWNNSVVYSTPSLNGFTAMAQYKINGTNGSTTAEGEGSFGVAAKYDADFGGVGVSYLELKDHDVESAVRVSGAVKATPELTLSALAQQSKYDDDAKEKENAYTVGGEYALPNSKWTLNAQYDFTDNVKGVKDVTYSGGAFGGDYAFTKATVGKVYAGYGVTEDKSVANTTKEATETKVGFGVVHSF